MPIQHNIWQSPSSAAAHRQRLENLRREAKSLQNQDSIPGGGTVYHELMHHDQESAAVPQSCPDQLATSQHQRNLINPLFCNCLPNVYGPFARSSNIISFGWRVIKRNTGSNISCKPADRTWCKNLLATILGISNKLPRPAQLQKPKKNAQNEVP